ncbi:hypothetical protein DCCM_1976 [Desulfocucumis palustris]|uniref:Uncharacterized protein n=1 Tax=Desulfocucumis palustris TaxID=1898651 RepID=A0A2L2X9G9_9FIRM|nr:hypothetical protein DCCM_1976 [Desulfocucumis palustris]
MGNFYTVSQKMINGNVEGVGDVNDDFKGGVRGTPWPAR